MSQYRHVLGRSGLSCVSAPSQCSRDLSQLGSVGLSYCLSGRAAPGVITRWGSDLARASPGALFRGKPPATREVGDGRRTVPPSSLPEAIRNTEARNGRRPFPTAACVTDARHRRRDPAYGIRQSHPAAPYAFVTRAAGMASHGIPFGSRLAVYAACYQQVTIPQPCQMNNDHPGHSPADPPRPGCRQAPASRRSGVRLAVRWRAARWTFGLLALSSRSVHPFRFRYERQRTEGANHAPPAPLTAFSAPSVPLW